MEYKYFEVDEKTMPTCAHCGKICEQKGTGYHDYDGCNTMRRSKVGYGKFISLCNSCSAEYHGKNKPKRPWQPRPKHERSKPKQIPEIKHTKSTCNILKQHAEVLSHDPDRLSTDFIKSLMHTDPKCD